MHAVRELFVDTILSNEANKVMAREVAIFIRTILQRACDIHHISLHAGLSTSFALPDSFRPHLRILEFSGQLDDALLACLASNPTIDALKLTGSIAINKHLPLLNFLPKISIIHAPPPIFKLLGTRAYRHIVIDVCESPDTYGQDIADVLDLVLDIMDKTVTIWGVPKLEQVSSCLNAMSSLRFIEGVMIIAQEDSNMVPVYVLAVFFLCSCA